ncbi:TetR family transcriptional regulator [Agaricicola taiwanensis]|uniref:TetR family transcriptional regulator n=1 Tax=Agaricicola taiwanensis TaxID=591372 RepID=A0A8J2YEZ8_9RHOB|nr:TetR/AcrR family transcriptional regulator [Agaricicola taiwanensis]GGE39618.1 TetR family transcriptional regulator [Agaricicola taiwanensis]
MQRTQHERSETTRRELIGVARRLFIEKGYAETSTPEIVRDAGITRGALYHHFADKRDLFRAVLIAEAREVADAIETATASSELTPREALKAGSLAYLDAMEREGRTRLMLIEAPAVLGLQELDAIDGAHAARTLEEGLREAIGKSATISVPAMAILLSAAFDRAALAVAGGAPRAEMRATMLALVDCVISV